MFNYHKIHLNHYFIINKTKEFRLSVEMAGKAVLFCGIRKCTEQ